MSEPTATYDTTANGKADKRPIEPAQSGKPSIEKIMEGLQKPIPRRHLEEKPASKSSSQTLTFCPWHRVQRILNFYTGGYCSYEVRTRTITTKHVMMTVRITIHAREGDFHRDGTGIEKLNTDAYGDPQSNAESMAFRRAAARFGLGIDLYEG